MIVLEVRIGTAHIGHQEQALHTIGRRGKPAIYCLVIRITLEEGNLSDLIQLTPCKQRAVDVNRLEFNIADVELIVLGEEGAQPPAASEWGLADVLESQVHAQIASGLHCQGRGHRGSIERKRVADAGQKAQIQIGRKDLLNL